MHRMRNRSLGRRRFLELAGRASALAVMAGGATPARAADGFGDIRHLLARTGFANPLPSEISRFAGMGYEAAARRLLVKTRTTALTPPPAWVNQTLQQQRNEVENNRAQRAPVRPPVVPGTAAAPPAKGVDGKVLAAANVLQERIRTLRNWWIEEMLVTDQPLLERMVLFWHNHFTSGFQKVKFVPALYRQNELFRRHALGNFADLLRSVARDPAMLIYLDGAQNRVGQPNENFARELLELFTLGEGHYAEADIKAAARAFTGWSIDRESGAFRDYPALRDGGEKLFLGHVGRFGGDDILKILLQQSRTAETIVEKLWRELVSFEPPSSEVKRLAATFRNGNYEMRPLLEAMLLAPQFRDPALRGGLIKSPVDLVIGTVRLLGLPVPEKTRLARAMQVIGQNLFDPPNVKGWPGGPAWVSTNTLMLRQQMLRRLIEATTVAPMDTPRMGRRAERTEQMAPEPVMEQRPVEGRSLRNAGNEARLGSTLASVAPAELPDLLLPIAPIGRIVDGASGGMIVAELMLDPAYQLK